MASGSQRRFVDWEERFVSHDRGSRVVHYYLRDRYGVQCLAVIGTERSLRHMVYVVCDEFLPLAGLDKSTTSAFKWRARREVVDWLSSFLVRTRSPDVHSTASPKNTLLSSTDVDSAVSYDGVEGMESGQEECRSRLLHDTETRKHPSSWRADVLWMGSAWICRKRLRHFQSFQRNGITISVQDFVYVMTEEKDRHIAYVEDLFEDKKQRKKLRVRWFHKTSELTCRIPPPVPHGREVFITSFRQDLSVECVDGIATVLTPEHHDACMSILPSDAAAQALMCYRQFDSEGIKPFNIQEVKGYSRQSVLSVIGVTVPCESSPISEHGSEDFYGEEEEGADPGRVVKRGPRTARCSRRRVGLGATVDGARDTTSMSPGEGVSADAKFISSSGGRTESDNHGQELCRYDAGDHIEMLSEDSGLRGCWFKGTVLIRDSRRMRVRYEDVECEDGKGNLEEWISTHRTAGLCKLGIRVTGRSSIRPPPPESSVPLKLEMGSAVDARWHDGWWEGLVCGMSSRPGLIPVYIPGEQEIVTCREADLRMSKEWFNGSWVELPSCPDAVKFLGHQDAKLDTGRTTLSSSGLASPEVRQGCGSGLTDTSPGVQGCKISVKEESLAASTGRCAELVEQQHLTGEAGCSKSVGDCPRQTSIHVVKQEQQEDGVVADFKQGPELAFPTSRKPSTTRLKWKVGRKRHRQGDLVGSCRMDRGVTHSVNKVKESSPDVREETSSDRNSEPLLKENLENLPRWSNGDVEEATRPKKLRQGNDSSLKSLHGTPMGSSMFIGSLPIANLVMSR